MRPKRDGVAMELREGDIVRLQMPPGAAVDSDEIQEILITLEAKTGRKARLRIRAGEAIRIARSDRERGPTP